MESMEKNKLNHVNHENYINYDSLLGSKRSLGFKKYYM